MHLPEHSRMQLSGTTGNLEELADRADAILEGQLAVQEIATLKKKTRKDEEDDQNSQMPGGGKSKQPSSMKLGLLSILVCSY